jgi:predicted heme/steroid binding protein
MACLASCHTHTFTAGGTIYQANGTTAASNVEIGIIVNGTLYTTYSGSGGNFYLTIPGTVNWSTAQIAIRTSTGTAVHPATSGLNGNCNSSNCHGSSNRIVVP